MGSEAIDEAVSKEGGGGGQKSQSDAEVPLKFK